MAFGHGNSWFKTPSCPGHVVAGTHYVCTHNVQFYSLAGYSSDAFNAAKAQAEALKAAGQPHMRVWAHDTDNPSFYLMDEPGDDEWDAVNHTGVCTDTHLDYFHTGCMDPNGAKFTLSITGCSGRAFGWATFYCGVEVLTEEDYVSNIGLAESSLWYPRTLVEETRINGRTTQAMTCGNPIDCKDKCERMERSARSGGLPAPTACALCNPPCPDNAGTSLVWTVTAFVDDVSSALQLAAICAGGGATACICQILMMIKPAWIDNLPDEIQECSVADLMMLILDKVAVAMIGLFETTINGAFIDPLNKIPIINLNLKRLCIPYKDIKDCKSEKEQAELAALLGCSFDDKSLWKRCYYERVRHARILNLLVHNTLTTAANRTFHCLQSFCV